MIKRDLGPDALILNTKQIKTGGYLGFFKKDKLEVIAAVEPATSEPRRNVVPIKPEIQVLEEVAEDSVSIESENPAEKTDENLDELMNELKSLKQFMFQAIDEDRLPEALKALN